MKTIYEHINDLPTPSSRKLRLFACSCVREIWHLLKDARSKRAVEVAERSIDGNVSMQDMLSASNDAWQAFHFYYNENSVIDMYAASAAAWAVYTAKEYLVAPKKSASWQTSKYTYTYVIKAVMNDIANKRLAVKLDYILNDILC